MGQMIGLIGTGNMGSAVVQAAARSGLAGAILLDNRTPAQEEEPAPEPLPEPVPEPAPFPIFSGAPVEL